MNSIFKKLVGGGSGNAPVAKYSPKKTININSTSQMLEGEAFQIPFTVAEDLWRAAFGDSWVGVDSLNDFHYGVACRLMFRNRMEKVIVDYEERVRIVE